MKVFLFVVLVLAAIGYLAVRTMSPSKRRFLKELARQIPYLIPRYFV
ncbi:MAG: hypothetical protein JXO48_12950 [Deltaproteobacteria bacterium]|nr:hypothetical protein [Deltaproteobacteria bacterium]